MGQKIYAQQLIYIYIYVVFLITDKLEGANMPSVESMQGNSDGEGNGTDTPYSIEAQVSSFAGVIFLTSTPRMIICFIKSY